MIKQLNFIFLILLVSCTKAISLSPYTLKYEDGNEVAVLLNDLVTFDVPASIKYFDHCNPENEYANDFSLINIESYAIELSEIKYMNTNLFSKELIQVLEKNDYSININEISKLISIEKKSILLNQNNEKYAVKGTIHDLKYKNNYIGESQWYITQDGEVFDTLFIENDTYFVTSQYLVYIKVTYRNIGDTSIYKRYSDYFQNDGNGYRWKSDVHRENFVKEILLNKEAIKGGILQDICKCVDSIQRSLNIIEYN